MLLALVAFAGSLKIADLAVGWLADSQQRHLFRLVPYRSIRHRTNEFDYTFRTNGLGFRGPDVPFSRPSGTQRVVVLGDSFVAGYGVADEDLLTGQLERLLNEAPKDRSQAVVTSDAPAENSPVAAPSAGTGYQVINIGRVGTSTIREYDLYERVGRRFEPHVVVLCYYLGNDLAEIVWEKTAAEFAAWHPDGRARQLAYAWLPNLYFELALLRRSRDQAKEMEVRTEGEILDNLRREAVARRVDPEQAVHRYRALPEKLRHDVERGGLAEQRTTDSCLEPDRLIRALDPDDEFFGRSWPRTEEYLDRLNKAVERDSARLAVVLFPCPVQIDRDSLEFHRQLGYEVREDWLTRTPRITQAVTGWARDAGVPLLDLTPALRNDPRKLFFIEDLHFNPAGHRAAAVLMAEFLDRRGLVTKPW